MDENWKPILRLGDGTPLMWEYQGQQRPPDLAKVSEMIRAVLKEIPKREKQSK